MVLADLELVDLSLVDLVASAASVVWVAPEPVGLAAQMLEAMAPELPVVQVQEARARAAWKWVELAARQEMVAMGQTIRVDALVAPRL